MTPPMKRTRFWYQSAAPIRGLPNYRAALAKHARAALKDTAVTFNGVREERYHGRLPAELHKYPYAKLVLQLDSIEFGIQAEREGCAAFIIGSFSEPFLAETRSVLDIPVVSLAEASLLTACSLAGQFALITLAPSYARRLRGVVKRHGLESRLVSIQALSTAYDEGSIDAAFRSPKKVIADFTAAAKRAVDAGADAVIPAEGLLSELLHANRIATIDGATVLDCVGAALLHADMMVKMKQRLGVGVGRRWDYARPPADLLAELRDGMKNPSSKG
jgi:Asp/Glu/hydantoin racemase